jgi:nucleotide-binding universal stress UspA family protein
MGYLVVGVDGSPGSLVALRFALAEARLRGSRLVAIHAWVLPVAEAVHPFLLEVPAGAGPPLPELQEALTAAATERLEAALAEVADDPVGVEVERRVVEGSPAATLVEASEGADLLVVGSRGHGGFRSLLLGSVSQQCAHHARCPVVIVPSPDDAGGDTA